MTAGASLRWTATRNNPTLMLRIAWTAATAQTVSLPFLFIALAAAIVILGIAAYFLLERRAPPSAAAPPGVAEQGYGRERAKREVELWQGIVRRLEIQARYQNPISERLQQELDDARRKLREAQERLQS